MNNVERILLNKSGCFRCYISLLVPSSYQYHIGGVPYIFHICSICVPYIFQYYIDMEYIWNTIGWWIDYLLFISVMMTTTWRRRYERNVFRVPGSVFEEFEILTKRDVEYSIWMVWVWKFEMLLKKDQVTNQPIKWSNIPVTGFRKTTWHRRRHVSVKSFVTACSKQSIPISWKSEFIQRIYSIKKDKKT